MAKKEPACLCTNASSPTGTIQECAQTLSCLVPVALAIPATMQCKHQLVRQSSLKCFTHLLVILTIVIVKSPKSQSRLRRLVITVTISYDLRGKQLHNTFFLNLEYSTKNRHIQISTICRRRNILNLKSLLNHFKIAKGFHKSLEIVKFLSHQSLLDMPEA